MSFRTNSIGLILALSAGTSLPGRPESPCGSASEDVARQYVTVTQTVSMAFGNATDREVDRLRLRRAAVRAFVAPGGGCSAPVETEIRELQCERIDYIASNRVVGVFSRWKPAMK